MMMPRIFTLNSINYEIYPDGEVYRVWIPYAKAAPHKRQLKGFRGKNGETIYELGGRRKDGGIRFTKTQMLAHVFSQHKMNEGDE